MNKNKPNNVRYIVYVIGLFFICGFSNSLNVQAQSGLPFSSAQVWFSNPNNSMEVSSLSTDFMMESDYLREAELLFDKGFGALREHEKKNLTLALKNNSHQLERSRGAMKNLRKYSSEK